MVDLSRIAQNRFIIFGRAGVDIYPHPAGVKTEEAEYFYTCLGGSSANIGVAIVKLGGKADLVTCVSDDSVGRLALNELKKYKVGAQHVRSVGGEFRTSFAVVESRVEDHQSVIYRNGAADFEMNLADVEAVDYPAYGCAITTGTALAAEPSRRATFRAVEKARAAGLPNVIDLDYRPYSWRSAQDAADTYTKAAQMCDIIVGNDDEFGVMAGGKEKGLVFAESLAKEQGAIAIYKMGEHGSVTFTADGSFKTGIFPVTALKPTGAGDSFMGALMAAMAQGRPLEEAVKRGSAAAALVVTRVGCAPAMPTPADLEEFLASHKMN